MKVNLSLSLLVLGLIVVAAPSGFAQTGVAGKWTGQLSAADGNGIAQPITIELKLDGTTLSGTVIEGALEGRPIQAAAVDGNNVTFRTTRNFGTGADINVNWKGMVTGDSLALSREIGPAPAEAGGGGRGGGGGGGRGGAAGGAAPAAGGRGGGGRGGAAPAGAAPAAGGRGVAPAAAGEPQAAAPIPPVPAAAADGAAAAGGRGGRGGAAPAAGGGRGGAAPAAGGQAAGGGGGRGGAAAAPAGPTVQLTLLRVK